jgi:hypothetical protein
MAQVSKAYRMHRDQNGRPRVEPWRANVSLEHGPCVAF